MRAAVVLANAVCLLAVAAAASGDPAAARSVVESARDAVLTVRITSKSGVSYRGSGERNESVTEATGCVIHPSGLTVLPLSTFDASRRMSQSGSRGGDGDAKYESEVTDVTLIRSDSSESPAELVMRDIDLDLAYVRPLTRAARPVLSFSLTASGRPMMFDTVIVIDRLGVIANRAASSRFARLTAIIDKPRWAGVIETSSATGLGAAVLDAANGFVGMIVMRSIRRDGSARGPTSMSVIVPSSDIAEGAMQALAVAAKPARKP